MAAPLLTHAPDEHSGRKLGKYEILCRLSTGGMSEIFLAFQRGLAGFRKYVVLKQILPDIKGEEEFVRMFLDEARITAAFNHPNIAQVFDLDIQDGELFLAMEFVPGATLVEVARATRQRNEAIPIGFTLQAVRDTALALHYAHTFTDPLGRPQTVIHRDVAEKNIMVTYEGVTKLLDFGIAKALGHSSRTSVGMVKGTSGYMSPEQILGEPLDARSDIFALGVVLHECLTGMRLFHGRTPEEAMMQALKGEVLPPSAQNAALPPELDQVTLKALQRRRDDRYATALELARAIERAAGPHIWHPEQSGEFVTRLFAQRRDATRKLMSEAQAMASELTGDFQLAKLLGNEPPAEPPPQRARSAPPSKAPPPEPKTIATQRREPPSVEEPPPPPPKAPERAPPRKRPPSARLRDERTTPGIRRDDLEPPDLPPREERTIPAAALSELRPPTSSSKAPRPKPRRNASADLMTTPARSASPKTTDDEVQTIAAGAAPDVDEEATFGSTVPDEGTPEKRRGAAPLVLALVGLVAIGGTVVAIGLHHDVGRALGLEAEPVSVEPARAPAVVDPPAAKTPEAMANTDVTTAKAETPAEPLTLPAAKEDAPAAAPAKATAQKRPLRRHVTKVATTEETAASPEDRAWDEAAAKAAGTGQLTLVTEPFSTVFLGSKELGQTPLVKLPIKSGRHVLRLVGADGKAFALPVQIEPDQETKVRVPLSVLKPL